MHKFAIVLYSRCINPRLNVLSTRIISIHISLSGERTRSRCGLIRVIKNRAWKTFRSKRPRALTSPASLESGVRVILKALYLMKARTSAPNGAESFYERLLYRVDLHTRASTHDDDRPLKCCARYLNTPGTLVVTLFARRLPARCVREEKIDILLSN